MSCVLSRIRWRELLLFVQVPDLYPRWIVRARLVWVHAIARSKEHIPTSQNGIWIVSILHTVFIPHGKFVRNRGLLMEFPYFIPKT